MKKFTIILAVIVVIIIAGGIFLSKALMNKSNELANVIVAKKGAITEQVSVTGKIRPSDSVNLAFEKGGRIVRVLASEGDKVRVGDRLVELDTTELQAQLREARASLDSQRAQLEELKIGTRPEEIAIKQSELRKAEQDLANYYLGIPDMLSNAYVKADDAVNTKTDQLFTDDTTTNPKFTFSITDSQIENDARSFRISSTFELASWKNELGGLGGTSSPADLENVMKQSRSHLAVVSDFLKKAADAVDKSSGLASATTQAYKDNVSLGRTNVALAISDVSNKEQIISAQKLIVDRVRQELNLKLAGATREQVASKEAQVNQAEANIQLIESQVQKMALKSPLKGVVTKQDAKVGEIIAPNMAITSVISEESFEIEANIPEVDIAKINVNDPAKITLDAYGNEVFFDAKVSAIDTAETIIEGVATYKVTMTFNVNDDRLKSGMTANVDILTNERADVLILPQRAVVSKGAGRYVEFLLADNRTEQREVKVGLRGSDGNIEITDGLKEGDKIVLPGTK